LQRQNYLCKSCGKQFVFRKVIDNQSLYKEYIFGKQTLKQLSDKYQISIRTVQRRLSSVGSTRIISSGKQVVVLMDATYWGRNFGVVVMKDARTKKILWRKFIYRKESLSDYREGVDWLLAHSFQIEGIVCDGLRGMFQLFSGYRVQMCQFHQVSIVKRYLTQNPESKASIELLDIIRLLCHTDKESFTGLFDNWQNKWSEFIRERYVDRKTGKTRYVHQRLRSAFLSIKRNMPYLWTWYDNMEVGIPNTNNGLEGKFTDLKSKLRNHNGLSKKHRNIFRDEYFKESF
jgi:hypothetical protein